MLKAKSMIIDVDVAPDEKNCNDSVFRVRSDEMKRGMRY